MLNGAFKHHNWNFYMKFSLKIYLIYIIMQMAMYYKHFLKLYFKGIITIASTIFEDEKTVV